jgi:predicted ATPase
VQRSLELASYPGLTFTQAAATVRAANVYQLRRDAAQTLRCATDAAALAEEHGYMYASSFALALKGWAVSMTGEPVDGPLLMQESIADLDRIGARMDRPYLLALLSEIRGTNRQFAEALALVTEALGQVRGSRTYFYEAELYRLRGALILENGGCAAEDEAEANFRQALAIAQRQKAKALELRAAVSLCRLLQTRGMPREGVRTLASVYNWFKEGSATGDLSEARELIADELDASQSF